MTTPAIESKSTATPPTTAEPRAAALAPASNVAYSTTRALSSSIGGSRGSVSIFTLARGDVGDRTQRGERGEPPLPAGRERHGRDREHGCDRDEGDALPAAARLSRRGNDVHADYFSTFSLAASCGWK